MHPITTRRSTDHGFTLVEVLVALAILSVIAAGVAVLFAVSTRDLRAAKDQTTTMVMATDRMEQLRSLVWGIDAATGAPISDLTTALGANPPDGTGPGLAPSPANSLETNMPGYVDFLDAAGKWVGTGTTPPPSATYIRRWQVEPLPTDPDTLLLRVLVTTKVRNGSGQAVGSPRLRRADEALLVSIKTRKAG